MRGLQASGTAVMVVGDGVNDAPALATASVGVAMGRHGSDLALDTADAIIIRDDLSAIPNVITLSRRARRFVIANLIIAGTFSHTRPVGLDRNAAASSRRRRPRGIDRHRRPQRTPATPSLGVELIDSPHRPAVPKPRTDSICPETRF
ncbi:HAD hydrolase family protein [Microbacterium oleivorans]|uniref:HAD hydrolase family protein n=1 Tax=Microbacterium TaxID=33882 RepID=UPI0028828E31|nr:HAD hydrolase family protein [Microbacterium sp. ARD31]MDT0178828.1 HAD hydrolase family protein [Microbacterium sp. ARD31]